jgi:hypothetical protein
VKVHAGGRRNTARKHPKRQMDREGPATYATQCTVVTLD